MGNLVHLSLIIWFNFNTISKYQTIILIIEISLNPIYETANINYKPKTYEIVKFAQSHIIVMLIVLISPSMSYAQTLYECKGYNGCFDPELSLEVGDVFYWDVLGVNITDQISTFEWRELRLTKIKLEIQEDIKGLSTSIQRNFDKYFELTFTLDGIETDYSQNPPGLIFGIISYTMRLDENGELYNIFIREVQNDRKYNYTNVLDFNNYTVYKYRYGDTVALSEIV